MKKARLLDYDWSTIESWRNYPIEALLVSTNYSLIIVPEAGLDGREVWKKIHANRRERGGNKPWKATETKRKNVSI